MSSLALGMTGFVVFPTIRREVRQSLELQVMSGKLQKQAVQLEEQAMTDPLSNLGNRRFFDGALVEYVREFQSISKPLGMILFDIDHFKSVNDTHGHDVGDKVIKSFARCIRQNSRQHDVAARIGGEEFALIIPLTSEKQIMEIAERIRAQAAQMVFNSTNSPNESETFSITVSGGIAIMGQTDTPQAIYRRADENLYRSKDAGRDQITI